MNCSSNFSRRQFMRGILAGAVGLNLPPAIGWAASRDSFSFPLLGDLHFDRLEHHDLEWLKRDKPDDVRQVRDYTRITAELMPNLFSTLRATICDLNSVEETRVPFTIQLGDLVEGLCGSEELARRQNSDVVEFVRQAKLGVPCLFTKGNHDVTGAGASEAFKAVFHPFLTEQLSGLSSGGELNSARYSFEYANALFCFFDAYDRESLPWLESVLARRAATHCFVILHPPAVPYGARATWNIFSSEREKANRERFLALLGKNNAFVLCGHIHKHNMLVRTTPGGGRFLQFAISSVISDAEVVPRQLLAGVENYNPDQVKVEPEFSPANEKQRRAVYETEAPFVKQFQYADVPGYAVIAVSGPKVTASIYCGGTRQLWRTMDLSRLLAS